MALREIKIMSSTRAGVKTVHSEATTWGQLQDSLSEYGNISQLTAVVKETKNTLQSNDAVLPVGDFTLYLSPKQIKAGNDRTVAILHRLKEKYADMIDELIEEIEDGDFDDETPAPRAGKSEMSAEDAEFLRGMQKMA